MMTIINCNLPKSDWDAINDLMIKMRDAWGAGDGKAYGECFFEDAHYVEAPGNRAIGRDVIAQRHQHIFDTFFKQTSIGGKYPNEIQPITENVILVHGEGNVLFKGEDSASVAPNGLMVMILLKRDGDWKIISFQNTPTGKYRGIKFFWRFLKAKFR